MTRPLLPLAAIALLSGCGRHASEPNEVKAGPDVEESFNDLDVYRTVLSQSSMDPEATLVVCDTSSSPKLGKNDLAICFGNGPAGMGGAADAFGGPGQPQKPSSRGAWQQDPVWNELTESFRTRNAGNAKLPHFDSSLSIIWVQKQEINRILKEKSWKGFHSRFRGAKGYATLSRPGYASGGRLAVVFFEVVSGPRAAQGEYCLLAREGAGWRLSRICPVWNS